jgi:hypothetical protein
MSSPEGHLGRLLVAGRCMPRVKAPLSRGWYGRGLENCVPLNKVEAGSLYPTVNLLESLLRHDEGVAGMHFWRIFDYSSWIAISGGFRETVMTVSEMVPKQRHSFHLVDTRENHLGGYFIILDCFIPAFRPWEDVRMTWARMSMAHFSFDGVNQDQWTTQSL